MQPTEYYIRSDRCIVVLTSLPHGLVAALDYSPRHNVSAVGVMRADDLAAYEHVAEEPQFWDEWVSVISDLWHL